MAGFSTSPEQRREIAARASTLRRAITGAESDRPAIGVALDRLFAAFPMQDPGVTAAARVRAYADALGALPAWAVASGCQRVIRGEAIGSDGKPLDKRFAPTPPQLADLVRGIVKPLADDLADLVALSTAAAATEPSAEERQRVGDGLAKLAGELKARKSEVDLPSRERALGTIEDANARLLGRQIAMSVKPMEEAAE